MSFRRGANVNVKTVSQVGVDGREVFLVLASPVDRADAVTVYYDDRGANAIRDRAGNRAFGFETGSAPRNEGDADQPARRAAQPHGKRRRALGDRPGLG